MPALTGPIRVTKERKRVSYADPIRYFHDLDPRRSGEGRFIAVAFRAPTTLHGEADLDSIYVKGVSAYAPVAQLHEALRPSGTKPESTAFEVYDSTSTYRSGLHRPEINLGLGLQRGHLAPVALEETSTEVQITADYDHPITGAWLAAAYHVIFKHLDREDVDLDFDPDDYPLV